MEPRLNAQAIFRPYFKVHMCNMQPYFQYLHLLCCVISRALIAQLPQSVAVVTNGHDYDSLSYDGSVCWFPIRLLLAMLMCRKGTVSNTQV